MAGPTTDYGYTNFGAGRDHSGYVTESVTAAACDNNGNCSYTFTHPVPAGATGTYAIGVEARRTDTILAGTTSQQSVEYGAINKVVYFSVDGSLVTQRRFVVSINNCNRCHAELSEHGSLRNQTEYCVLCHNPSNTDSSTRPSATVLAQKNMPNQGIAFDLLIHRVHTGLNLEADFGRDYTVVGYGGSINDFSAAFATLPASLASSNSGVRFPAMDPTGAVHDTANCEMCHIRTNAKVTTLPGTSTALTLGTETNLPLGLNPVPIRRVRSPQIRRSPPLALAAMLLSRRLPTRWPVRPRSTNPASHATAPAPITVRSASTTRSKPCIRSTNPGGAG